MIKVKLLSWFLCGLASIFMAQAAMDEMNQIGWEHVGIGFGVLVALCMVWIVAIDRQISRWSRLRKLKEDIVKSAKQNGWLALVVAALAMTAVGCGTRVGPGYVGIKVQYAGGSKGVDQIPLETGWVAYMPGVSTVLEYPTFVQTAKWTKSIDEGNPTNEEITFTTADQMVVSADISLSYHLDEKKIPAFYVMFRNDDINHFTHGFLRNQARDKFDAAGGKYQIERIMGDNAEFMASVRKSLQDEVTPIGVVIDQLGFIGAPRPPEGVITAINEKARAQQITFQKQFEVAQVEADAKKSVAAAEGDAKSAIARAEGAAKANAIIAASITPNVLEWERLNISRGVMSRWNGVLPTVSGGVTPMLQLPGGIK